MTDIWGGTDTRLKSSAARIMLSGIMRLSDVSRFIAALCLAAMVLCGVMLGFLFWMLSGTWFGYLIAPAILVLGVWWLISEGRPREKHRTET